MEYRKEAKRIAELRTFLLEGKETTTLGKHQRATFTIYILILVVGIGMSLAGLTGPDKPINIINNSAMTLVCLATYSAYLAGRITVTRGLSIALMAFLVSTVVEMVDLALAPTDYGLMLIVANIALLAACSMQAMVVFLKNTCIALATISIVTYCACTALTGNEALLNFLGIIVAVFAIIIVLALRLNKNMKELYKENATLSKREEDILSILKINRNQIKSYVEMSKRRQDAHSTSQMLDLLGYTAKHNLIENVNNYLKEKESNELDLKRLLPELSPSEIEICRLLIQGMKQTDICLILNKKPSNVSCQRANIRRKLGLKPTDDLREQLILRVK